MNKDITQLNANWYNLDEPEPNKFLKLKKYLRFWIAYCN
jgi:hypothetical protein